MEISKKQLELVDAQIKRIIDSGNYYSEVYKQAGITGVSTPEDFKKIPFTDKADLRNAYPLGIQAVPDEKVVRIHSSSGTTGKPVIIPYTAKDVEDWATMFARCYEIAGITSKDRIQITPGYGLWTAGIGFQAGCEKLGAMAIPMGPGNTEKQLQMMIDLESTVICATSSYALLLAEEINKRGLKDKIKLKKGIIGSERWSEAKRNYIAKELGITVRYAGDEPYSVTTGIYNDVMEKILPEAGIEFRVLPRLRINGEPVSASMVRQAISEGDLERASELLPPSSIAYFESEKGNGQRIL